MVALNTTKQEEREYMSEDGKTYEEFSNGMQVTDMGKFSISILFRDKVTGEETEGTITRARLAKYYSQYQVIGSKQGRFVVEV